MKVETYAETPVWELSHQLPHLASLSAADVQTLFCISETRTQTGTYTDGSVAYQLFWEVRAVSWPGGKVIGRNSFTGSLPSQTKEFASGAAEGLSPYKEFAAWIFNQIQHPDFLYFKDAITSLAVSPNGRLAAFGSAIANQIVDQDYQAQIYLFNPASLQTILGTTAFLDVLEGHQGIVTSLAFSPGGNLLASSGYDRFIKLWDVTTGALLGQISIEDTPNSLAFSPDGTKLAVAANLEVSLIDLLSRQISTSIPGAGGDHLAFSPDGSHVYNNSSGAIKIIDLTASQVTLTFPDTFALVPTLSVAADGSILGVTHESPATIEGFALSPDGAQIVTYTIDRTLEDDSGAENVRLASWEAKTGKYVSEVRFSGGLIHAIQFSEDGNLLATGNRNEVWIWDTSEWQVKKKLAGHTSEIVDLAIISPETVLSASRDGTIRVWSLGE
jgi:WD40 repeat protein